MGTKRSRPKKLPGKLKQIRKALGLSQVEMMEHLTYKGVPQGSVSNFELGRREPSLPLLLAYANIAGVCLDVLVDDAVEIGEIPGKPRHRGYQST